MEHLIPKVETRDGVDIRRCLGHFHQSEPADVGPNPEHHASNLQRDADREELERYRELAAKNGAFGKARPAQPPLDVIIVDPKVAWAQKRRNLHAEADKLEQQILPAKSKEIIMAQEAFIRSSGADIYDEKAGIDAQRYDRVSQQPN